MKKALQSGAPFLFVKMVVSTQAAPMHNENPDRIERPGLQSRANP
jgi:hypothetical protein